MSRDRYNYFKKLWDETYARRNVIDSRIQRRRELYAGTDKVKDFNTGGISSERATCYKNICFEMVETQINNAIPQPKVTPRNPEDIELALEIEGYLKSEIDRMQFETVNDEAERETYIQGTCFYMVDWDSTKTTPTTQGELTIKAYTLDQIYPQWGIKHLDEAEYIFVKELVQIDKIKKLYGVTLEPYGEYVDMTEMITCYYYNKNGYVSRYAWSFDTEVFDQEAYEMRQFRTCTQCGTRVPRDERCPVCGNDKFKYETAADEILTEDIIEGVPGQEGATILAAKGTPIPYYAVRKLPFVMRRNISDPTTLYGVSDIDIIENQQDASNKLLSKMQENVLKGGSFITIPDKTKIPVDNRTLKVVPIKDPRMAQAFQVVTVQANVQQEDILQQRMYDNARVSLGITDSYQGKRDPTAESGKAKEIAAAQSAGRLESKKRMKEAAYADLYQLMFYMLLAYCDERRTFSKVTPEGQYVEGKFYRYNFLAGEPGNVYYNDQFIFSVDSASVLSTNREAMWQETTANFQAGTFGNPADPATLMLYWNTMKGLGYPLAKTALASLQERSQELPYELQQVIMQNPSILEAIQAMASGQAEIVPKMEGEKK